MNVLWSTYIVMLCIVCVNAVKIFRTDVRDFIYRVPCDKIYGMTMKRETDSSHCYCVGEKRYIISEPSRSRPKCVTENELARDIGCRGAVGVTSNTTIHPSIHTCERIESVTKVDVLDWDDRNNFTLWNAKKNRTLLGVTEIVDNSLRIKRPKEYEGLMARIWIKCKHMRTYIRLCVAVRMKGMREYPLQAEGPIIIPPSTTTTPKNIITSTVTVTKETTTKKIRIHDDDLGRTERVHVTGKDKTKNERKDTEITKDEDSDGNDNKMIGIIVGCLTAIIIIIALVIIFVVVRKRKSSKKAHNRNFNKPHYEVRPLSKVILEEEIIYDAPDTQKRHSSDEPCGYTTTNDIKNNTRDKKLSQHPVSHPLLLKSNSRPFIPISKLNPDNPKEIRSDDNEPDYAEARSIGSEKEKLISDYDTPENEIDEKKKENESDYAEANSIASEKQKLISDYDTPENEIDEKKKENESDYAEAKSIASEKEKLINDYDTPENEIEQNKNKNESDYAEAKSISPEKETLISHYDQPENDDVINYKNITIVSDDPDYYSTALSPRDSVIENIKGMYAQVNKGNGHVVS